MNVCHKCNSPNIDEAVFCFECGMKLNGSQIHSIALEGLSPELSKVPGHMAKAYLLLPLKYEGKKSITVAMANPSNMFAIDDIRFITGCNNVEVIQAKEDEILAGILKLYGSEIFADDFIKAVSQGNKTLVEKLISLGMNLNSCAKNGYPALLIACVNNHDSIAEMLIKKGADVNKSVEGKTPLMWTCRQGHTEVARLLVEKGADVNTATNPEKYTALMVASELGHFEIVELLVDSGADLYALNMQGHSALNIALEKNHYDIAELLQIVSKPSISLSTVGLTECNFCNGSIKPNVTYCKHCGVKIRG